MKLFEKRLSKRRFLVSMFYVTLNNRELNRAVFLQLLAEVMVDQLFVSEALG